MYYILYINALPSGFVDADGVLRAQVMQVAEGALVDVVGARLAAEAHGASAHARRGAHAAVRAPRRAHR